MNSLNRTIEKDEVVIIDRRVYTVKDARFICKNGLGMSNNARGGSIAGTWVEDGEYDAIYGSEIDSEATAIYQEKHGRFLNEPRTST